MSEAARLTAAAGLLSSWASPAAIVPSDSRRSRFCSAPARRDITGFICLMTRSCTARMRERQAAEVVGRDERDLARDDGRHAHGERPAREDGDGADPRRRDLAPDRLGAAVVDDHGLRLALEQAGEAEHVDALLGQQLAGLEVLALRDGGPLGQLRVVEVVEEVDRAQVGDGDPGRGAHAWARYSWMSETAIDPSPTALATRLIERARTSPATKTPGTLVSSG